MKRKRIIRATLGVLVAAMGLFAAWLYLRTRPASLSSRTYVRFDATTELRVALDHLQEKGILLDATATNLLARLTGKSHPIEAGVYRFQPNATALRVLAELREPIHQALRIPAQNWAARTARLLEKYDVCSAEEYLALVASPDQFRSLVSFPLPTGTLEGYLYGDTYDLPPMTGARTVVEKQLKAFEANVWNGLGQPKELARAVIIGSMVELEVKFDDERATVAGVIENRLLIDMPLQIDASINYGLQEWRPLRVSEYRSVDSPYNLYRHKGLPPTPICSPSAKSIDAALHPADHGYLYYVAMPDGKSVFASEYAEHLKNVKKRREAIKALKGRRP